MRVEHGKNYAKLIRERPQCRQRMFANRSLKFLQQMSFFFHPILEFIDESFSTQPKVDLLVKIR